MGNLDELSREDLWSLALAWRRRALHGDRTAHGPAHLCESAYRRRFEPPQPARPLPPLADLRPLAPLPAPKRWRFWSSR